MARTMKTLERIKEMDEEEHITGSKRAAESSVPERRMRQEGYCEMLPTKVPVPDNNELLCYMALEKRIPRALQKQADKEEIHLYKEAEAKQWKEHLKYKAIRIRG